MHICIHARMQKCSLPCVCSFSIHLACLDLFYNGKDCHRQGQPDFLTETAVTPEWKVEKSFPRWEINRHYSHLSGKSLVDCTTRSG